ncbi:MAG TPA: PE domain-containing protein, partial [Mycobacterium sp.]|nr:PE domain-containing protein [Mycobacterium sp.]
MEPLSVNPAVVAIGSQVVANGTRGLAAGTTATATVTALAPAGAEEVSLLAVAAFAAEGLQTMGINTMAQE